MDASRAIAQGIATSWPARSDVTAVDRVLVSGALTGCTYSSLSPIPGQPEPDASNAGDLLLVTAGTLDAADPGLELAVVAGGLPDDNAAVAWGRTGEDLRGRCLPQMVTGWQPLVWTDGSITYSVRESWLTGALGLASGRVVVAYEDRYVSGPTTYYRVRVQHRAEATGTWTEVAIYTHTGDPGHRFWPVLWVVDQRLYLGHLVTDYTTGLGSVYQLRVYRSDDEGETWAVAAAEAVEGGLVEGQMRATRHGGGVVLVQAFEAAGSHRLVQYHALDEGLFFRATETETALWYGTCPCPLSVDGELVLLALEAQSVAEDGTDVTNRPTLRRVTAVTESLADAAVEAAGVAGVDWKDYTVGATVTIDAGEITACLDWDGRIWLFGRSADTLLTGAVAVASSADGGLTWESFAQEPYLLQLGDSFTYPVSFVAAAERGRLLLATQWVASPGNEDASIGALWCGGWDTRAPAPELTSRVNQMVWTRSWLPWDLPGDLGYTVTTGGTVSTNTLVAGYWRIVTASGLCHAEDAITPGSNAEGATLEWDFQVVSGGSTASFKVGCLLRVEDGTDSFECQLWMSTTAILVYDGFGGSLGTITRDNTARSVLRLSVTTGELRLLVRPWSASATDLEWVDDFAEDLSYGTPVGSSVYRIGIVATDTAEVRSWRWHVATGTTASSSYTAADWATPDSLYPARLGAQAYPLDGGCTVALVGGHGQVGDVYDVRASAEADISVLLPEVAPSPRRVWRSANTGAQIIPLQVGPEAEIGMRDTIVCALYGINFRRAYLDASEDGASWDQLASLDAASTTTVDGEVFRTDLRFLRAGRVVYPDPDTSGGGTPMILTPDVAGGLALFGGTVARRIGAVRSGRWASAGVTETVTPCRVQLDGIDGTEDASGTNLLLCAPRVAAIIHTIGAAYRYFRLRIPSQVVVEEYFEVGTWFLGPVQVLGQRPGNGRRVAYLDGTLAEDQEDGQVQVYEAAPGRRTLELGWPEGVDTRGLHGDDPVPDHWMASTTTNAPPVAIPEALPSDLVGLWTEQAGQAGVIAYCPFIPRGPPDVVILSDHATFPVLSRMTGPPDEEVLIGDEVDDELIRTSVVLDEVV